MQSKSEVLTLFPLLKKITMCNLNQEYMSISPYFTLNHGSQIDEKKLCVPIPVFNRYMFKTDTGFVSLLN